MIKSRAVTGSKTYDCTMPACGKKYSSRFALKRHVTALHIRFKKFVCQVCTRQFS